LKLDWFFAGLNKGIGSTVLQQLKGLYHRLDSGIVRLKSKLRSHDEQLEQLRASVAALAVDGMEDPDQRRAAKQRLEEMLVHRAVDREELERLLALYESAVARVAAAEAGIAELRERLSALERASGKQAGDRQ